MNDPKISVIIPVYNVEKYLSECLDSIINQTLREIEVICVNDGSTDSSLSILKEYSSKDNRVKIIDKKNEGQGYARKVGLDIAKGEYILFCDSDDKYSSNNVFENLYKAIKKNNSDLMCFSFEYGNKKNSLLDIFQNFDNQKSSFIFHSYFAPWFKIYKKSFLDRYKSWCFPKYLRYQDMPFHIQACLRAESISYFDKVCYSYRNNNPNNVTNSKIGKRQIENICEIILLVYDILKEEKYLDKYKLEFSFLAIYQIIFYFFRSGQRTDLLVILKETFEKIDKTIKDSIKEYKLKTEPLFPYLSKEYIILYKLIVRLDLENLCNYIEFKKVKNYKQLNYYIRENKEKDIYIEKLKKSLEYRVGKIILLPFSKIIEFLKFIRNYNLIKKSGLFDIDYYFSQNEDLKKIKIDPIKHYLKIGWKEGRNPSANFNTNAYLSKRFDVKFAKICPLVHYIMFGKNE